MLSMRRDHPRIREQAARDYQPGLVLQYFEVISFSSGHGKVDERAAVPGRRSQISTSQDWAILGAATRGSSAAARNTGELIISTAAQPALVTLTGSPEHQAS